MKIILLLIKLVLFLPFVVAHFVISFMTRKTSGAGCKVSQSIHDIKHVMFWR